MGTLWFLNVGVLWFLVKKLDKLLYGDYGGSGEAGYAEERCQAYHAAPDKERTLDPLLASQAYNIERSPIYKLPEELLVKILIYLLANKDLATLCCLGRVSRTFRRLISDPGVRRRIPTAEPHLPSPISRGFPWRIPFDQRHQFYDRLRRDVLCSRCRPARLAYTWGRCKFHSGAGLNLHCDACGSHHDIQAFPPSNDTVGLGRQCLGRQGAVRLCEHVHIYWADVDNHITYWRKRRPRDYWNHCTKTSIAECHDPSHDTRCGLLVPHTWPRARLKMVGEGGEKVDLVLEWQPHSGKGAIALKNSRQRIQIRATELRAVFQRHRKGAAAVLVPSRPSATYLPEMACFARGCQCVYYEDMDTSEPGHDRSSTAISHGPLLAFDSLGLGCHTFHHGFFGKGCRSLVRIREHQHLRGFFCFITSYQRSVPICRKEDSTFNPSHVWLHAMDPDTYPAPRTNCQLTGCSDSGCMNYYRRCDAHNCGVAVSPMESYFQYPCDCVKD